MSLKNLVYSPNKRNHSNLLSILLTTLYMSNKSPRKRTKWNLLVKNWTLTLIHCMCNNYIGHVLESNIAHTFSFNLPEEFPQASLSPANKHVIEIIGCVRIYILRISLLLSPNMVISPSRNSGRWAYKWTSGIWSKSTICKCDYTTCNSKIHWMI